MATLTTKNSGLTGPNANVAKVKLFRGTVLDGTNGEKRTAPAGEVVEIPHWLAAELCEMGKASYDLDAEVPLLDSDRERLAEEKAKKK